MHLILIHFPTTAGSAQFCLLCCQPEPIPGTLAARKPLLTPRVPCRLPVWSRMNHLHELQDIVSSPTLHRQVLTAQESGFPTKYGATFAFFFFGAMGHLLFPHPNRVQIGRGICGPMGVAGSLVREVCGSIPAGPSALQCGCASRAHAQLKVLDGH